MIAIFSHLLYNVKRAVLYWNETEVITWVMSLISSFLVRFDFVISDMILNMCARRSGFHRPIRGSDPGSETFIFHLNRKYRSYLGIER